MSVKISDLKLEEVRRVFSIKVNDEEREIKVFNLIGDDRAELLQEFKEVAEMEDNIEKSKELFTKIYKKCTNIEMDDALTDVLRTPSVELMQVHLEIQEIVHELQCQEMISKINEVNQVEAMMYVQLALKKSEKVENLMNKIKELEKEDL